MQPTPSTKKSRILGRQPSTHVNATRGCKPLDFDPSRLRFPISASPKKKSKMASAASKLFQLLVRTGIKFRDDEWNQDFQLTVELDAAMMVLSERQHSEWHTSPQVEAVARIIVEVAVQATEFNKVFGYAPSRPSTFEEVVAVMDQIASAVGPLADYRQFHMDVVTASIGLRTMFSEQWGDLFSIDGKCNRAPLKECLSRLIFIYYPDYVEDSKFLKDATTATLSRTVKRSENYEFLVCKVDPENSVFIKRLAKQLEKAELAELRVARQQALLETASIGQPMRV